MEHIVQFAIGIDDEAIVKRVTQVAEKQIVKAIQEKAEDQLSGESRGSVIRNELRTQVRMRRLGKSHV